MATCKDCLHGEACEFISQRYEKLINDYFDEKGRGISVKLGLPNAEKCPYFKDRSQFVELPCKVGDVVYCIYHGKIERSGVTSICIGSHYTGIVIYTVQFSFTAENIGEFIFFSVKEAEQALKERERK